MWRPNEVIFLALPPWTLSIFASSASGMPGRGMISIRPFANDPVSVSAALAAIDMNGENAIAARKAAAVIGRAERPRCSRLIVATKAPPWNEITLIPTYMFLFNAPRAEGTAWIRYPASCQEVTPDNQYGDECSVPGSKIAGHVIWQSCRLGAVSPFRPMTLRRLLSQGLPFSD